MEPVPRLSRPSLAQRLPRRITERVPHRVTRYALAGGVFAVIAVITVVAALVLRSVVSAQERRLLNERAAELSAYLNASGQQTAAQLTAVGEATVARGAPDRLFHSLATALVTQGRTVAVAQLKGGHFVTIAADGKLATVGQRIPPATEALFRRALAKHGMVFSLYRDGAVKRYVQAVPVAARAPTLAFATGLLPAKPTTVPTTKTSPYRELDVAIYVGTQATDSALILINGARPDPDAHPVHVLAAIGVDQVLIVTAAHAPLVGSFTHAVPWLVLAGGLLLAVLVALLVHVLARRREYALKLVEQRTRAMHQAQLAAEAANRSKSEFLSRMSHELRTPLNAVLGFSQLLELDDLSTDQEQSVRQITRGGRHLLDLINEILDISQIETGMLALSPEAVPVRALIAETLDLLRSLAAERGITLLSDGMPPGRPAYVFADRQRLKQILLNLVGNGIKYNREGGTVSITCVEPTGGTLRIQVTDTGPGIAPEHFELLFTPFERLGAERTTIEGTGIGLALSRRLADVMGGALGVESTPGRGSTFWVEFPVVEGPVDRLERLGEVGDAPAAMPVAADRPAILHVEDNLANIQLVERVLAQRPGVRLIPAMQGRLGLELARQHHPVLVLLDLNLADVGGEEVLRALRDDPVTATIPVVIISADAMPRQVQRLLSAGATAYLTKPIDVRQLLELVDRALATGADEPAAAGHASRPAP